MLLQANIVFFKYLNSVEPVKFGIQAWCWNGKNFGEIKQISFWVSHVGFFSPEYPTLKLCCFPFTLSEFLFSWEWFRVRDRRLIGPELFSERLWVFQRPAVQTWWGVCALWEPPVCIYWPRGPNTAQFWTILLPITHAALWIVRRKSLTIPQ